MNEEAQKVFDYLLRNFYVHFFEKEQCIIYNLHYSSTVYFNRLLQNIDLKQDKHFSFLAKFAEKDQILYRSTLVKQIAFDSHMLLQLIKYNERIAKLKEGQDIVFSATSASKGVNKNLVKVNPQTFLLAVLTELLGIKKNNENFLSVYTEVIAKFIIKPHKIHQLSFSLTLLVSLVVKERQRVSVSVVQNFVDYLLSQLNANAAN